MDKEYILYCDESQAHGLYYSNFYGGVMVGSSKYMSAISFLEAEKAKLNLFGEVKWSKVTTRYLEKYILLIKAFFCLVKKGDIRVRIMFRQNAHVATNLTTEDHRNSYFKLYYQFIKHAFGLNFAILNHKPTKLRLNFDIFPENREAALKFKGFLLGLNQGIAKSGFILKEEDITEVDSRDHILLQCLDIVLGSMQFTLNDKMLVDEGAAKANRTIAKELLYNVILEEIRQISGLKDFNIEVSTFAVNNFQSWIDSYRHWLFIPRKHVFKSEFAKKKEPQPAYNISDA